MGRTACTEPQCLYKGALYLLLLRNKYHKPKPKLSNTQSNAWLPIATYSRTPFIRTLDPRIANYPDRFGPSGKSVENSTKLPCLEITGNRIKYSTVLWLLGLQIRRGRKVLTEAQTVNSNSRTSDCHCSLLSNKNPIIWIFCISGLLAVPINPDKWSSTVYLPLFPNSTQLRDLRFSQQCWLQIQIFSHTAQGKTVQRHRFGGWGLYSYFFGVTSTGVLVYPEMEAASSSKTSVPIYQSTRCHTPETGLFPWTVSTRAITECVVRRWYPVVRKKPFFSRDLGKPRRITPHYSISSMDCRFVRLES